ncbi:MAG TPA: hypothetical protein V6C58_23135 [Allocoleopsis sp.]
MTGEIPIPNFSMPGEHIHRIDIKIKKIGQLFNSMDPSPFLEKDLDDDAFEYIVSSVQEHPLKTKQKIVIHIPKKEMKKNTEPEVTRAIHNFFEYKKILAERSIKLKLKEGQLSFVVGITFLISCLAAGEYILTLGDNTITYILFEGLLIGGWVAMWKPISDVLYEWWPIYQEKRVYNKISRMEVEFKYD